MPEDTNSQLSLKTPTINMHEEIDSLNMRAWSMSERDAERAVEIAENAGLMSSTLKVPYRKGIADSSKALGRAYIVLNLFESALTHLLDALVMYQRLELLRDRAYVMYLIGKLYLDLGDMESARRYLHPAAPIASSLDDHVVEQEILTALGRLYYFTGDNAQATAYLKQVVSLGEKSASMVAAEALSLLSEVTFKQDDVKLALEYGLKSLALYKELNRYGPQLHVLRLLGMIHLKRGEHDRSLNYYQKSLELAREKKDFDNQMAAKLGITRLLLEKDPPTDAVQRLEQMLRSVRAQAEDVPDQRVIIHRQLAEGYTRLNDHKRASTHYASLVEIQDRLIADQKANLIDHVGRLHTIELSRKDSEVVQLRQQQFGTGEEGDFVLRQFENLRDQLNQEISEREALISELNAFAHTVAHDLKSPINLIVGFAGLLEENLPPEAVDSDSQTSLNMIKMTAFKMNSIVEDLMLLAGVRENEQVTLYPLSMPSIIHEVEQRLAYEMNVTQATIIKPDKWLRALGYAPWVEAVWVNYISNAIKYGGKPPVITLGCEQISPVMMRFTVTDNGNGISASDQARLFTEFIRLDRDKIAGHGIGLSIVKRIIERLGGEVGVMSVEGDGKGSTFYFTLPAIDMTKKLIQSEV